jgi:ABC-type transport system involved in cytochrome c biogenesis permease subunit
MMLLASVSFVFVPFCAACLVLAIDSPIPHQQRIRADRASVVLLLLCLLLQPVAARILRSRLFPKSAGWRKVVQFVGMTAACAIVSIGLGLLMNGLAEERWRRVALSVLR